MNLLESPTNISLAQWVPVLQRWFPLRHALVVGQSHELLSQRNVPPEAITHFKAGPRTLTDHTRPWLIAERSGPVYFYQNSLPAESGLLSADDLKCCWPGIKTTGQQQVDALSLDSAAEKIRQPSAPERVANWLWLGCLPGVSLLRGAQGLLQRADVVAVRVVLHPQAEPQSSLAAADNAMRIQGFALCGVATERNPQLGIALYIKDYPAAHAKAHQQCLALTQDKAELQTQLAAETQAKQAEATAKAEAQKQRDELAKAKTELQAQLAAETQAKQAEAAAKAEAQKQRDELAKAKADLQSQLAVETQAKQTEATAKAEAQMQRDELAKAKADLQSQLSAENQAKQAEAEAREAEKQAKDHALGKAKALDADKAQLAEAKDKALAKTQQLTQEKTQLQKQVEELTKQLAVSKESLKDLENRLRNDMSKGLSNAVKQLEAFQRIRDFLGTVDGLGDFHGWPISPDIGLFLIDRMREHKYDLIIEFGSGTSTALLAKTVEVLAQRAQTAVAESSISTVNTKIVTFEHDRHYYAKTLQLLKARGLESLVQLINAPLVEWCEGEQTYLYYDCQATLSQLANQNTEHQLRILVLVDGPPGSTSVNARYPAIPFVFSTLARHLIDVVLDDASRPEEKQVISLWKHFWEQRAYRFSENHVPSEKGIYLATPHQ